MKIQALIHSRHFHSVYDTVPTVKPLKCYSEHSQRHQPMRRIPLPEPLLYFSTSACQLLGRCHIRCELAYVCASADAAFCLAWGSIATLASQPSAIKHTPHERIGVDGLL
jgi:hypothetical protein